MPPNTLLLAAAFFVVVVFSFVSGIFFERWRGDYNEWKYEDEHDEWEDEWADRLDFLEALGDDGSAAK